MTGEGPLNDPLNDPRTEARAGRGDDQSGQSGQKEPPISTGGGDGGTTTLLGAGRMPKHDARIEALGDVDEASSALGVARAEAAGSASHEELTDLLLEVQRLLYRVMGDLAMPEEDNFVGEGDVDLVDRALAEWKARTRLPNEFVIPGESRLGSLLDASRSVVRRAERRLVAVGIAESNPQALRAVNRLSDLLFVAARNADGHNEPSRG